MKSVQSIKPHTFTDYCLSTFAESERVKQYTVPEKLILQDIDQDIHYYADKRERLRLLKGERRNNIIFLKPHPLVDNTAISIIESNRLLNQLIA